MKPICYLRASNAFTLLSSTLATVDAWVRFLFCFLVFFVKMWLLKACFLLIFPDPVRANLFLAPEFFTLYHAVLCAYAVLAVISNCYPPVWGRLSTRYSPVRHSVNREFIRKLHLDRFVRLACVRHAASVHPEPGSNSHVKVYPSSKLSLASFKPFYCCFRFCSECSHSWPITKGHFYKNFQGFTYCSVFKVLCCCLSDSSFTISQLVSFVNNFFQLFSNLSRCLKGRSVFGSFVVDVRSTKLDVVSLRFANDLALSSCFAFTKLLSVKDKPYLTTRFDKSQHLFSKIFKLFFL